MCKHCDDIDNAHERVDLLSELEELTCERVDALEFKNTVLKRYLGIHAEHASLLEDRVVRLEAVLSIMCHSLGIKLQTPLTDPAPPRCNHGMGDRISVLDLHLRTWDGLGIVKDEGKQV